MAALLYQRARLSQKSGLPAPRHLVWIGIGVFTTLTDLIETILEHVGASRADLAQLPMEQQLSTLLNALRRPQENALIVLDEFEMLLNEENYQSETEKVTMALFLDFLRADLGASRFVLTSLESPYKEQQMAGVETRVRSFLVSRITLPEGVTLLQQCRVFGSPDELSLVWQRCSGHVFALTLFASLSNISGIALSYLLNAPDYQPMWNGDVVYNIITAIYHFLNPVQYTLMRTLGIFYDPVSIEGILMTIAGDRFKPGVDTSPFERGLQELLRLSLVQRVAVDVNSSLFTIHPLLRQYVLTYYTEEPSLPQSREPAASDLSSTRPRDEAELRKALALAHKNAAAYYQYTARKYCPPREQRRNVRDVFPIIQGIRHLCLARNCQNACEWLFAEHLHESLVDWKAWSILCELYMLLLPPAGVLLRRDEGLVCSMLGLLYGRMNNYQKSQAFFDRALSVLQQIGDKQGEATILLNQGELLRQWNERKLAYQSFERATTLNVEANDPAIACAIFHNLGLLCYEDGRKKEAFRNYARALKLTQDSRASHYRGTILTSLATVLYEQGAMREALASLIAAMQQKRSSRDPSVAQLEHFLKMLERKLGAPVYKQLYQEALNLQDRVLARITAVDMRQL
jgi:tetratricopeptide (TPR) repeat protein